LSTARIIEAILGDQHRVLPVSTLQTGAYGLYDVCLSLPTVVSRTGAGRVLEIPLSQSELMGLQASADTLKNAWASISSS
jgi:L-lactate dehydrogenase